MDFRLLPAFTSAPWSSSSFMVARLPKPAAWWSGVAPAAVVRIDELGIGGDQLPDGLGIAGADGRDERREFGIDRLRRGFFLDLDAELGALVDPGAENSDLFIGERAGGRHLQAAVAIHEAADEFACGAVARDDHRAVIAAAERVLALVEPKAGLLDVFAVAGVALLRKQRLDIFFVVDFPSRLRAATSSAQKRQTRSASVETLSAWFPSSVTPPAPPIPRSAGRH